MVVCDFFIDLNITSSSERHTFDGCKSKNSMFPRKILKISPFWWCPLQSFDSQWDIFLYVLYILLLSYFSLVISILMRFFSHKLPFFAFAMAYQSYFIASDFQVSLQEEEGKNKKRKCWRGCEKKCWDLFVRKKAKRNMNTYWHSLCTKLFGCMLMRWALRYCQWCR